MKMAIACWEDRVAPTFDAARQIHIVESESGKILSEQRLLLHENAPFQNASLLAEQGVHTLVCGAISIGLQKMVMSQGIQVIAFISGSLQEITQAWLAQKPLEDIFAMPGCCGRRRYRGSGLEQGMGRGIGIGAGMGPGKGRGMGRGMQGVCLADPVFETSVRLGRGAGNGMGMGRGGRGKGGGRGNNF